MGARRTPHAAGDLAAFGDAQRHVVEHRKLAEEGVDLERAAEAPLDARGLRDPGDILAAEDDPAGGGRERSRQHVDEGGLARAVRADERMARTGLEPEIDVAGDRERAEALA